MAQPAKPELLATFGTVVRRFREQLGISQEELADRAGVHRTYVGDIERGRRNVALINIDRLARALDTDIGVLMAEVEASRKLRPGS